MNIITDLFRLPSNDAGTEIMTPTTFTRGFAGDLNAKTALVFEDDRIILAVEYDFDEAPIYVDFHMDTLHIDIVQETGDIATLAQATVPVEELAQIQSAGSIALVTGSADNKLLQVVKLRVRGLENYRSAA
tara:strand:- start:4418 stop:4810 length:393 start_codon:yes stop_codon:yes gene_type:complete